MAFKTQRDRSAEFSVLVVEDSSFLREILRKALRRDHYTTYAAPTLKDAWRVHQEKRPAIVFVDIGLPDGNGHDLAYRIKRDSPDTYVVMATASDTVEARELAGQNNVDGFITKPFKAREIEDCIEHCLLLRDRHK